MRIALDTNRYIDAFRGVPEAMEIIRTAQAIYVPFIVTAELRTGFLGGNRAAENEQALIRFLQSPRVQLLYADDQTTHHYARPSQQLR
ncbi:MAG TPA: hypothetical protein VG269_29655 [Tepidisphaeraceae bacterium]|jgi:predicted nucleic acid-binding protein|nr:hypothetical protein [Tepidisphaeraceae bacterium]